MLIHLLIFSRLSVIYEHLQTTLSILLYFSFEDFLKHTTLERFQNLISLQHPLHNHVMVQKVVYDLKNSTKELESHYKSVHSRRWSCFKADKTVCQYDGIPWWGVTCKYRFTSPSLLHQAGIFVSSPVVVYCAGHIVILKKQFGILHFLR